MECKCRDYLFLSKRLSDNYCKYYVKIKQIMLVFNTYNLFGFIELSFLEKLSKIEVIYIDSK